MTEHEARELARDLAQVLDRDSDNLAPAVCTRLRQARRRALSGEPRTAQRGRWIWLPAGALVAGLTLVLVLARTPREAAPPVGLDLIEVVTSDDDLDLIEDLDFYQWLDANSFAG